VSAYLQLAAAMAIVGSSVVVGKLVVARVPVFVVGGLRFALASVILLALAAALERPRPRLAGRDVALLVAQAFAGIFAFNTLLLYGLTLTSAAASGIVTATTPGVAAVLSALLLRERWTRRRSLGVGLAVAGLLALNLASAGAAGGAGARPLLGNLLVFGAVVGEGVFVVCGRAVSQRLSPLTVATGVSVLGLAMFAPFALVQARAFDVATLGAGDWLAIAYYGVVVTVVAFLLWARGIARVPAGTAAVFTGVLPLSALALSWLVLGERVGWPHLGGAVCVIAGIVALAREGPAALQ
jgi:drug/metabolite transporter (DMT)-like permease